MHTKDTDENVHSRSICNIPNLAVAQLSINSRIYNARHVHKAEYDMVGKKMNRLQLYIYRNNDEGEIQKMRKHTPYDAIYIGSKQYCVLFCFDLGAVPQVCLL